MQKLFTIGFVFFTVTVLLDYLFGKGKVKYSRWLIAAIIYTFIYRLVTS
ncbi:hypothetical protein MFMK1_001985 [Metallumcola ferriviriculae]|uniref:Uncharacterized protein n=1 Tax=Metallumcola ferriviriculae TaxID=3039180 RepID=A0AAU0UPP3_9FIRM|nr:hypothetical protein MFMK1_001985 [Desulfitibacteraceae bacterium MK1]